LQQASSADHRLGALISFGAIKIRDKDFRRRTRLTVSVGASQEQLEFLYRSRYGSFRNGLAPLTGGYERAHDVVQEAFARALRERDRFRGEGSLEGWVWRIAFRVALDERRNGHEVALDEAFERAEAPADDRDPELAAALRSLPGRRRLVVFLRYFADLSYTEIGELCGISEGTVAATLSRAHADLLTALSSEGARS
jgi:RNA polymerase sigma-70 factor (ECF subfamily)